MTELQDDVRKIQELVKISSTRKWTTEEIDEVSRLREKIWVYPYEELKQ